MRIARAYPLFVASLICLVFGCSGTITRHPISGTVKMDGKPLALAIVNFYPADPKADQSGGGTARTDDNGNFTYGEDGKNTGLVTGEFKITVSQTLINGKPSIAGSGGKKGEKEKGEIENVPDVYRSLATTTLTAKVSKTDRTITIEMQKQP